MPQRAKLAHKDVDRPRVLVVDDEPEICRCLERCLGLLNCSVETCANGTEALDRASKAPFHIVFTDLRMPGMNGIEVVRGIRRVAPGTKTVVLTGYGTIESAVEAIQAGAVNYLTKPFKLDDIRFTIDKILSSPHDAHAEEYAYDGHLIGHSPAIRDLRAQIDQVAAVSSTALVFGETGVGKEVVAKAIHARSERRMRAFVPVNCGAIPENLLESELFGYERGAFTGADETRAGKVEAAHHGTLFLDEIAETSIPFQVALLRVLQEREVVRVGGNQPVKVDFRLIAATNRNLLQCVREGAFRQDLYYRLNVISLAVPPLREHREDIPELVEHFMRKHRARINKQVAGFSPAAMNVLVRYSWPGNIRQLENVVEKTMVLTSNTVITPEDLPPELDGADADASLCENLAKPLRDAKEEFERGYIEALLRDAGGNVSEAARKAHVARTYLHERMRRFDINPGQFRQA